MKGNNIYDAILNKIFEFENVNNKTPNAIVLGKYTYKKLSDFVYKYKLDEDTLKNIHKCKIMINLDIDEDILVVSDCKHFDDNYYELKCKKDKCIKDIDNWFNKNKEKAKMESIKNSDKIDKDLDYLQKEMEFERWYNNRTKNEK